MSSLASLLEHHREAVMLRWTARERQQLDTDVSSERELRDHFPALLLELQESLQHPTAACRSEAAIEHGRQRFRIGFDLEGMVREYGLLRSTILDLADEQRTTVLLPELRRLMDFFSDAIARSVNEYVVQRLRSDSEHDARESARLNHLFENAPAFVALLRGPHHVFQLVNPRYQRMMGSQRKLIGLAVKDAAPELVEQGFIALLDSVYQTGAPYFGSEVPLRLDRRGDGTLDSVFVNFVYQAARNARGEVEGIDVFGFETTDEVLARRKADALNRQLIESQDRLRVLVEASGAGLWDLDALDRTIQADARMVELMGLPPGSAFDLLTGLESLPEAEDRERVGQAVQAALEGADDGKYHVEFRTGGRGEIPLRWVESRAQVFFEADGRARRLAGAMIDVTPRKLAERERHDAFQQVTEVLESMGDAFFALDPGWRFTLVNRKYERLSGKSREETLGRRFWELFPASADADSPYRVQFHRCMEQRTAVQFLDYAPSRDRWTDVRAVPQLNGSIAVFSRDVSTEKRAEQTLREQAELEQQLIGIVSHDLRNPISAITMSAATLLRRPDLDERQRRPLGRILASAERTSRMVRDLLDFTQARLGGGLPVTLKEMDFHLLARQVVDETTISFPQRVVALEQVGDGRVRCDSDRLAQVLGNLLGNALHYSPAGTPVHVLTRGTEDQMVLEVRNQGTPIPASMLPQLFLPMRRGTAGPERFSRSVGLGLYIVKQIVDAHGGTVRAASSAEDGIVFTVKIPRVIPDLAAS